MSESGTAQKKAKNKRVNANDEIALTTEEVAELSSAGLARMLAEFNEWRRGIGKYAWHENPSENKPCPYSPATIGYVLDEAALRLALVEDVEDSLE